MQVIDVIFKGAPKGDTHISLCLCRIPNEPFILSQSFRPLSAFLSVSLSPRWQMTESRQRPFLILPLENNNCWMDGKQTDRLGAQLGL